MPPFRARARTVDLLGRQQIAGIPTAISELFKNAHDAYANHVEADYFRASSTLILRDDGLGMTPEDFVDRWLTLGTESKVQSERGLPLPAVPKGPTRPILGEKGIGRLAIASIGPQVLVLTRGLRNERLSQLTVALINWRLFELPGVNLDELDVPSLTLPGGTLPTKSDLAALAALVRTQLKNLATSDREAEPVLADLATLEFSPAETIGRLAGPSLVGDGHGTQFVIAPTAAELADDIDPKSDGQAPPLVQTLIGFANTMLPDSPSPRIQTAFRDHSADGLTKDLIAPAEFFTPDDFATADHQVRGTFDELGDFSGSVQVYGGAAQAYDHVWTGNERKPIACGPFSFDLAYVQGVAKDTRLPPIEHARVTRKLDQIGGLYIYRDDIRVLPYGTPDFDFLGIERRRTQNLSRAFFSYRRMFGVVRLTNTLNRALQEKAGREGFIYNTAYRQFRAVLSNLFVGLAGEFFNPRGERAEDFEEGRDEARRRYQQRRDREARASRAREKFAQEIGAAAQALRDDEPQRIAADTLDRFATAAQSASGHADAGDLLTDAEGIARRELDESRRRFWLREPVGFGLTTELRTDWDELRPRLNSLDATVWEPALQLLAAEAERAYHESAGTVGRRERLTSALQTATAAAAHRLQAAIDELRDAEDALVVRIADEIDGGQGALAAASTDAAEEAKAELLTVADDDAFADLRISLEASLRRVADEREEAMLKLASHVQLAAESNGSPTDGDAATLEEEVLGLRERTGRDLELAQLGMASEILA